MEPLGEASSPDRSRKNKSFRSLQVIKLNRGAHGVRPAHIIPVDGTVGGQHNGIVRIILIAGPQPTNKRETALKERHICRAFSNFASYSVESRGARRGYCEHCSTH